MFRFNTLADDYKDRISELNTFMDNNQLELNTVVNTEIGLNTESVEDILMESVDLALTPQSRPSISTPNNPINFSAHESDDIDWNDSTDPEGGLKAEVFNVEVPYYAQEVFFETLDQLNLLCYAHTERGNEWAERYQNKLRHAAMLSIAEMKEKKRKDKRDLCKSQGKKSNLGKKRKNTSLDEPPSKSNTLKGQRLSTRYLYIPYDDEDIILKIPLCELNLVDTFFEQKKETIIKNLYDVLTNSKWSDACYRCDIPEFQLGDAFYKYTRKEKEGADMSDAE